MVVRPAPMRDRLVAVEADFGEGHHPRWQYGSGLLIGGRQLLTAAHVVQGARGVTVRAPGRAPMQALLVGALIGALDRFDLAVLDVPEAEELAALPVAGVNRDVTGGEFVEGCWAVGFPAFQEVERDEAGRSLRESAEVKGEIPPLSGLREDLLSFQVTVLPRALPSAGPLDTSEWSGMSGAAVFAGSFLVGVVTEHSPRRGPSDVTVTPLAALLDPEKGPADSVEWRRRLAAPASLPLLPVPPSRPEPDYRATLRVIHHWTPMLVGRDDDLARISAFAAGAVDAFGPGTGSAGYVWLVGGPWAGKTALLAEAVHSVPAQVDVVAYFLIARDSQASREQFLTAVVPQLAWLLDENVPQTIDIHVFQDFWERAAARAEALGRHLLLVVDGLDEDLRPGGLSVAAALPTERLGKRVRVLVASRIHYELPDDVVHHPLLSVQPVFLTNSHVSEKLGRLAKWEIEKLLPRDPEASSDLVFDILGLLTAAHGALSISDLATMMNGVKARSIDAFISNRAARSLEAVGPPGAPRYRFAHQTLLEFCEQHPYVGRDPQYRERLNTWAEQWRAKGWPVWDEAGAAIPGYLLDSYPAALAGDPEDRQRLVPDRQRLAALVGDIGWLDTAIDAIGVDEVLAMVRIAARLVPDNARVSSLLRLLQLQAHNLRSMRQGHRPGRVATQLAWEALRAGLYDIAHTASDRLRLYPAPQLIPLWTTERASRHLARNIGFHNGSVWALTVTGQGKVVSGGNDGVVRLWDPDAPEDVGRELGRHENYVRVVAVTGQGKVVSGGNDGVVRLWDPDVPEGVGRELGPYDGVVSLMAVTSQGKIVFGCNKTLRLWDPEVPGDRGRELGRHEDHLWALAITGQGKVVSGGSDGVVRLWDPDVPEDRGRVLGRHTGMVCAMAVTGQGKVVSGGFDGAVRLWDPDVPGDPGRVLGRHNLLGRFNRAVRALAVTGQGKVVSGGDDRAVRLWDPDVPGDPGRELGRHNQAVCALAVTGQGKVVSGSQDGAVRLWDPHSSGDPGRELGRHNQAVCAIVVPGQGKVVSSGEDGAVRLWDPDVPGDPAQEPDPHNHGVEAVAIRGQGKVIFGGWRGVWQWDPDVSGDLGQIVGRHGGVLAVAVTRQGKVVSGARDGAVRLYDPDLPGDPGREIGRYDKWATAVAVGERGEVAAGYSDGTVWLWDRDVPRDPGRELGRHDNWVSAVAVTGQGKVVSTGVNGVRLWDPDIHGDSGRKLGEKASALSSKQGKIIAGRWDGEVQLWDLDLPGGPGLELGRGDSEVRAVAATEQGSVISIEWEGAVRLWDPRVPSAPSQEVGRLDSKVHQAMVTDDGQIVIGTPGGLSLLQLTSN